ncbi:MAG: winged helix-turn-helix domain-containing protein [Bacteriovoracia bacterium]
MNVAQIEQLVNASQGALGADARVLAGALLTQTQGNPQQIKMALAASSLEGKVLTVGELNDVLVNVRERAFEKITARWDRGAWQDVRRIGLVRFEQEFASSLAALLTSDVFRSLNAHDLVRKAGGRLEIAPDFLAWTLRRIEGGQEKTLREEILSDVGGGEAGLKEKLWQMIKLGKIPEAAALFSKIAPTMVAQGESVVCLELSAALRGHLAPESALIRLRLMYAAGAYAEIVEECSDLKGRIVNWEDASRFELDLFLARSLDRRGDSDSSLKVLSDLEEGAAGLGDGGMYLARVFTERGLVYSVFDAEKALDCFNEARRLIPGNDPERALLNADILFGEGYSKFRAGRTFESVSDFQESLANYSLAGKHYDVVKARLNLVNALFFVGNLDEFRKEVQAAETECQRHSYRGFLAYCRIYRSNDYFNQGLLTEAKDQVSHQVEGIQYPMITTPEDLSMQNVISCYFRMSDYGLALELARKRLLVSEIQNSPSRRAFSVALINIAEALFLGDFKLLDKAVAPEVLDQLSLFERPTVGLMALEAYYRFSMRPKIGELLKQLPAWPGVSQAGYISIQYRFFRGVWEILGGQLKQAEASLIHCNENASRRSYFVWQIRSTCFLALIDLALGRVDAAERRLLSNRALMERVFFVEDLNLYWIGLAAVALRRQSNTQAKAWLAKIPDGSKLSYLVRKVSRVYFPEFVTFGIEPTEQDQKYYDALYALLGLKNPEKVQVYSRGKNFIYNRSELDQKVKSREYELLLREEDRTASSGDKTVPLGAKPIIYNLLQFLLRHPQEAFSKEELALHVWHEKYNPLVHDARIYTSVKRVRSLMKSISGYSVVESHGHKYSVNADVRYGIATNFADGPSVLTERQDWIIKYLENNGRIHRATIEQALKVSPTLCKRELRSLVSMRLIAPIGRGRNTHYKIVHNI